jgi:hypothetical protein
MKCSVELGCASGLLSKWSKCTVQTPAPAGEEQKENRKEAAL